MSGCQSCFTAKQAATPSPACSRRTPGQVKADWDAALAVQQQREADQDAGLARVAALEKTARAKNLWRQREPGAVYNEVVLTQKRGREAEPAGDGECFGCIDMFLGLPYAVGK